MNFILGTNDTLVIPIFILFRLIFFLGEPAFAGSRAVCAPLLLLYTRSSFSLKDILDGLEVSAGSEQRGVMITGSFFNIFLSGRLFMIG